MYSSIQSNKNKIINIKNTQLKLVLSTSSMIYIEIFLYRRALKMNKLCRKISDKIGINHYFKT